MTAPEIWKAIPGYEEYQASTHGRIKLKNGRISNQKPKSSGYISVNMGKTSIFAHILVALAFLTNDDPEHKTMVDHIDSNKSNNRSDNLQYVTPSGNSMKKDKSKVFTRSIVQMSDDGTIIKEWRSAYDAAKNFGITESSITAAIKGGTRSAKFRWAYFGESLHKKDDLEGEEWITGKYKDYDVTVSNKGRVITLSGGKTFGGTKGNYKYTRICSDKKLYPVHQIICTIYHGEPPSVKHEPNHLDNNGFNNCPENLVWATRTENTTHAKKFAKKTTCYDKKAVEQYSTDGELIATFESITEASKTLGIRATSISCVCRNTKYKTAGGFVWKYVA